MNGTRYGDFSRLPFDRKKRFTAVRVQQGRVQLDADFNETSDIAAHQLRTALADLLGASGAPAGEAGFGVTAGPLWLELGVDGHFVLIGGTDGFELPEVERSAFAVELQVLPRNEGQLFGCWVRRESEGRFKSVYGLRIADGRLCFQRPELSDLVTPPLRDLLGRRHTIAVVWTEKETTIEVGGLVVARDANRVAVPQGPLLFLLGSRQAPLLAGLFGQLRLWQGVGGLEARRRHANSGHGDEALPRDTPGLAGWWRFAPDGREGDDRIPDLSLHGNEALVRGSGQPPRWLPCDCFVGSGRYYLDGLLCESFDPVPFDQQPDLPGARLPQPRTREREHHLFYLDVWERSVSALEDPEIREVALGGADTTLREQVVAQVRTLAVGLEGERPGAHELHAAWPELIASRSRQGRLLARRLQRPASRLDNRLYRIEIHDAGDGQTAAVQSVTPAAEGSAQRTAIELSNLDEGWSEGQVVEVFRQGAGPQDRRVVTRVVEVRPESQTIVLDGALPRLAAPTELRVRRIATFKWSRNNAAQTFPIAPPDAGNTLTRVLPTPSGVAALEVGSWVEQADDGQALAQRPEPLHRVEKVDGLKLQLVLEPPLAAAGLVDAAGSQGDRHPLLRLWDQQGGDLTGWGTVAAIGGDWQELEVGIQVRFGYDAPYRSGDYWQIPARTLAQDIEWPRDSKGTPRLLPPHGVNRRRTPLALLTYDPHGFHLLDLRRTFQPYISGAVSKAGDWMEGPLDVRADLAVRGDLEVEENGRFGAIYGPLRSRDAVGTPQIQDRSVTPAKLSDGVGLIPDGWSILGPVAAPPPGFVPSGWALNLVQDRPRWVDRRQMPGGPPGHLVSTALDGKVYTLLESGLFWEFDPLTEVWTRRPELPTPVRRPALATLDGKIYAVGGLDALGRASRSTFEYDPAVGRWTARSHLRTGRSGLALVACEGQLHALGGLRDSPSGKCTTARHEAYHPPTDSWIARRPLPERLTDAAGVSLGVWIHLAGGETRWLWGRWGAALSGGHHQYNATADRWTRQRTALPTPRRALRLVETFGKLYAVGGESEIGWLRDFESYDPSVDRWAPMPPLHDAIEGPGACALNGAVYVVGALRAGGALIEECQVATQLFVHRRSGVRPNLPPPLAPDLPSALPPVATREHAHLEGEVLSLPPDFAAQRLDKR